MNFSDLSFDAKLDLYAELLVVHGLNVQPGQVVNVTGEIIHRDIIQKVVKAAYKRGAKLVNVDFIDPLIVRLRIQESKQDEYLQHVPGYIPKKFEDFVEEGACVLRFTGSEEPDSLADLPAQKINDLQNCYRQSLKKYYAEGVGKSKIQWTVAAAATPKWAKKVFPELDGGKATAALWDSIFHICRIDLPDFLQAAKQHRDTLQERARKLTGIKIRELHFVGPDTDLKVFLSPKALFKGGGDTTPKGVAFEANVPTEECFTTPDYRLTEGKVRVTRPVFVNGESVKDLQLEFKKGEIVNFKATQGQDNFAAYIANDPGAKRLGEVALVGIDSPIFQSKRIFEEILFDENAACHIAVGFAYRFCLANGAELSPAELEVLGCNDSHVHTDFMISNEHVDVFAKTYLDQEIQLIKKGQWVF